MNVEKNQFHSNDASKSLVNSFLDIKDDKKGKDKNDSGDDSDNTKKRKRK